MKNCPTCHLTYPNEFTLCPHDGGTLETKAEWSNGMVVRDKYRIMGPIGAGGMATVYKAEHIHFREVRALKVISSSLSGDDGFVRRFMQEAVLTRRLQHPNAVRVDDIDRGEDGRPFIVMEFIDGISLRDAMQPQVPMNVERACRIAKQVASALGAAHALGMVHRDIKPANIFLANTYSPVNHAADGEQAKVLDFGIAKVKESHLEDTRLRNITMTGAGMVIGTPSYMSPEQAAGKRGDDLDGRSDLYSLGVVLYQMLSGDLPLNAESDLQLLMAHLVTEPVPIQQRVPDVPPLLAYLVMRCLAKEPSMRPADAHALIAEIEEFERSLIAPPVVPVAPVEPRYQVNYAMADTKKKAPFFTRTKAFALAAILLFAMGLGAFGIISHFRHQAAAAVIPLPVPAPADKTAPTEHAQSFPASENAPADIPHPVKPKPLIAKAPPVQTPVEPIKADSTPVNEKDPSSAFSAPQTTANTSSNGYPAIGNTQPSVSSANNGYPPVGNSNHPSAGYPSLGNPSNPTNGMQSGMNHPAGGDILSPAVVSKVEPKFSQEAKSFRYSGTTILSVVVDEHGVPGDIQVLRAAGYGLDKQAVDAISRWRFSPGLRNGVAVRARVGVQVNFRYAGLFSFAKSSVFYR